LINEDETIEDLQLNGLHLIQKKNAFRFGMDSVLLAHFASIQPNETVADFGTGNGILIFLLYGRNKGKSYYALDIHGALARNPNTPVDVLLDMLNYEYLSEEDRDVILKHRNLPKDKVAEVQTALAEEKKKNSLRRYIGKDVWLSGELYGISRDFLCYFRIVHAVDSRKKIYEVNVLYDNTSWNNEPIEETMQETEIERFDDSEESDGKIYKPVTTYTTDELLKKLYPDFDEE
jgi:hypothetical protein